MREPDDTTAFVSTGKLPEPERVRQLVAYAHDAFASVADGELSRVYPALAEANPELFGIAVASTSGDVFAIGDADVQFTIQSVSKPFVFALVCDAMGADEARRRIGVNATGLPFNSVEAVAQSPDGRTNPMVNPGAIATTSLVAGDSAAERWESLVAGLSRFAGRALDLDEATYGSGAETNFVNRSIANLLRSRGRLGCEADEAVDLYTRQCSLSVTARDLAVMGATLADGGVNPVSGERVVSDETCRHVLAVMTTAGLYETSGDWLYDVGLPGKSGIGGGVVTIAPGKGGLGTFSPLLDAAGNSVRGTLAAGYLSRALGLDLFASEPVEHPPASRESHR